MVRTKRPLKRIRTTRVPRELFDDVIDCLYEYDLGEVLPDHWPRHVRVAIEAARKRIMNGRGRGRAVRERYKRILQ